VNKPNSSCILSQDPLFNAMLSNTVKLSAVVYDIVTLSTGNVLVFLKERDQIQ
jgi:hypothetical protein